MSMMGDNIMVIDLLIEPPLVILNKRYSAERTEYRFTSG